MSDMWVMSYQLAARTSTGNVVHRVGSTVTKEHPLVTLKRWNEMYARQHDAIRFRVVLTWYAKLSDDEVRDLEAAGLDLTAQDIEIDL